MTLVLAILFAFVCTNVFAFGLFGWDKACAESGKRRVPESELLFLRSLAARRVPSPANKSFVTRPAKSRFVASSI